MREVVLDTETTGLDPDSGDRLIEIACVELVDKIPSGATYHQLINPERDVSAEAIAVHGITTDKLASEPVFSVIAAEFLDFVKNDPLVIHNAAFDIRFLNAELTRAKLPIIPTGQSIDTLAIARRKFPGAPASLNALCRRYAIDLSARDKHNALLDAKLLARVYLELAGGAQRGLELLGRKESMSTPRNKSAPVERPFRQPRPHDISDQEARRHAELVARLNDPLWPSSISRKS